MSFTEDFTDQVGDFGTGQGRFTVMFLRHAAEYEIRFDNEQLVPMIERLARAWKSRSTVKITARGTEVVSVEIL